MINHPHHAIWFLVVSFACVAMTSSIGLLQLLEGVISIALQYIGAAIFRPKGSKEIIRYPANQAGRDGYLPLVLGRRVVGPTIGWVGGRHSHAAPHAGGSELTAQPSTGDIYYEAGWHQLCHGPTRKLRRIWAGSLLVSGGDIDATTTADGANFELTPTTGARDGDSYRIYFGRDPNVNPDYQPIDNFLQAATSLNSCFPGLTYIFWLNKNLGYAPQWPLMKYEIENRPDDVMTACGLEDIFTPNNISIWFNESTPAETSLIESGVIGVTVWLNGQQNIPAGTYTITYLYGAFKLSASGLWQVFSYDSEILYFGISVVDSAETNYGTLPWTSSGDNTFATQVEAETANAGATATLVWPGGVMGFRVVDVFHRPGMVPGLPNPTYSVQLASNSSAPVYTAAISVSPGAPGSGDSGVNPACALWILLCAPFPYGCGMPTTCIDQTALLAVGTQMAAERLVINVLIDNGRPAMDAVASIMADIGLLLPQVGGLIKPYLIRTETTVPEITDDLRVGPPPEQVRIVANFMGDRLTFQIDDVLNNYAVSNITLDNDAQAFSNNRPQQQTIKLENITSRITATAVAYRRAVEMASTPHAVTAFQTLRETRNPVFHPGRSFLMGGNQYRITSWQPDTVGVGAEIEAVLDQYGDTSVTFDTSTAGNSYTQPVADAPLPDLFFNPFVIPRSEWPAIDTPVFGVPRVRANDDVSAAFVWISNASSGTYNQIGSQDNAQAGGLLLSAFNNSPGVLATGPSFSPYNDDTTDVPDLTGDASDYATGALTVLCESEIMLLESLTANMDGSYTLNNITRGAFGTTVANHSTGTPMVVISSTDMTGNASPLLASVSPAGGTLWVKTQPTDGNTLVDLSIVTPEPLVVPPNLLAIITITAPYGLQKATLGLPLIIQWQTQNLTGLLNIDLSEDGGATWTPVVAGIADTGSYSWIVSAPATFTATLRVSSAISPTIYAISYPFYIGGNTIAPDVMSSNASSFGSNISPGVYTVAYIEGAINYNTAAGTVLVVNGPSSAQEYVITYNGSAGSATVKAPGLSTVFSTVSAVQAANLGQTVTFVHFGGAITVACVDTYYPDNAAGPPSVTFGISSGSN